MRHSLMIGFLALSSTFAFVSTASAQTEDWITMRDYEGVRLGFTHLKDDLKHPAIEMKLPEDDPNTPMIIKNADTKKQAPADQNYLYLFKNVIQNDSARCVFYDDIVMSGYDEFFPSTSDLYSVREWEFNRFEKVPTYWKKPGVFPVSFSVKARGRTVKVLCTTKDHVLNKGAEAVKLVAKTAYTSYAKLLNSFGVNVTLKDGTFFAAAKSPEPKKEEKKVAAKPADKTEDSVSRPKSEGNCAKAALTGKAKAQN